MRQIDILKQYLLDNFADKEFSYVEISDPMIKALRRLDKHQISISLGALYEQELLTSDGKFATTDRGRQQCRIYRLDVEKMRASLQRRERSAEAKAQQAAREEADKARQFSTSSAFKNVQRALDSITRRQMEMRA